MATRSCTQMDHGNRKLHTMDHGTGSCTQVDHGYRKLHTGGSWLQEAAHRWIMATGSCTQMDHGNRKLHTNGSWQQEAAHDGPWKKEAAHRWTMATGMKETLQRLNKHQGTRWNMAANNLYSVLLIIAMLIWIKTKELPQDGNTILQFLCRLTSHTLLLISIFLVSSHPLY